MTILSDHPAHERDGDTDQIGLKPRLAAVLDILRHKHTHCPVTIAIYGDWGTGKSSAMRWLAAQLTAWNSSEADRKGHPCVYHVWFDPWKYHTREEVWRGIIAEVILKVMDVKHLTVQNVLERLPAASKNLLTWLARSTARVVEAAKLKTTGGGAEVTASVPVQTIVADFHNTNHPEDVYLNAFEKDLREWVEQFLGKDSRLCLFIDDLDRCLPDVTLEVLEALKLYLNIPQLIFVVGLDRAVVDGVVRKHYEKHGLGVEKARHYLDKIFQVEVAIAPSQTQVEGGYFREQIKKLNERTGDYWKDMLSGNGYEEPIERTILKVAGNNPREIKRLLNSTLRSGREAAERAGREDDKKLYFAQGAQVYLLSRYVQSMLEPPLTANNLLVSFASVIWLSALSETLRKGAGRCPSSDGPPGRSEAEDAVLKNLLERTPEDDQHKKLNPIIFQQPELRELLCCIPFSFEVAQAAAPIAVPSSDPAPAVVEAPAVEPGEAALRPGRKAKAKLPDALAKQLKGVDPSKVTTLNLSGSNIGDGDLAHLKELTQLQWLVLDGTQISDAGLEHLKPLTQLQGLGLALEKISDAGLEHLKPLTQLQWLVLVRTKVSDAGLERLKPLTKLQRLLLSETQISDTGLAHLMALTQLQVLSLSSTEVSDAGLEHLKPLTQLRALHLACTKVSDAGLEHLKPLAQLQWLSLDGTKVGDAGLAHLKPLTQLQELWLKDTQVTKAGVEALQKQLPKCKIDWPPR